MKSIPPYVDANGDINVHGRQGVVIYLRFTDDNGDPTDVSAKDMMFECGTDVNVALVNGATSDEKVLTLTNAHVKTIFNSQNKQFVVLETSGAVPDPKWEGQVFVSGWIE